MSLTHDQRSKTYAQHVESFLANWYERFRNEPQTTLFDAMQ